MSSGATQSPLRALQDALQDGRLSAAVRRREHGDALDDVQQALEAHGDAIDELEALAVAGPFVADDLDAHSRSDLGSKLHRLQKLSGQLCQETSTKGLREGARILSEIERLVNDVASEVQRGWCSRIKREFTMIKQLGTILKQLGAAGDLGWRMRLIAERGLGLELHFPPQTEHLQALQMACDARDTALEELAASGSGLSKFLLRVATDGATLADLDEETWDWLRTQGVLGRFSVRL